VPTLLVAGASGLIGQAALEHFDRRSGWDVLALSRRRPDAGGSWPHLAVDLLQAKAVADAAPALRSVTHVLFAALIERPGLVRGWRDAEQMQANLAMLVNLMAVLQAEAPGLQQVTLLQGTKAYGVHLHPIRVPARERWPRDPHPNFYWLQEDWLRDAQRGKPWQFTIFRPQIVIGHALGSPMNMLAAIGAYGAILKARGEKLHWPGGAPYVSEAVCARLIARAVEWAATTPVCGGEVFNLANGDVLVWQNAWPAIARALGMEPGENRPLALAEAMPACEDEWATIVRRHNLQPLTLERLVGASFQYADFVFAHGKEGPLPHAIVSTVKARQMGFADCEDTEDMFARWFAELQARRILPPV
jgi:nucleoside-diphosphate-sugar epimerase